MTSETLEPGRVEHDSVAPGPAPDPDMCCVPGATFLMGSDHHYAEEAPAHVVTVDDFWMDRCAVTNREFERFVEATGYVTLAERPVDPAHYPGATPELFVPSSVVFMKPQGRVDLRNHYNWWTYVAGASWRHPRGPGSSLQGLWDHPVVHVALEDAEAYAHWAEKSSRPKRSGSWPRAAGSTPPSSSGATSCAERQVARQHLARRVSVAEPDRRRSRVNGASRIVSAERLRAPRDGRQRLGVDDRLVSGARQRRRIGLLCANQSPRR